MPRITVIPSDRAVYVDGEALELDFEVDSAIHAIQFDGTSGWIEFNDGRANQPFTDASFLDPIVNAWRAEKEAILAEEKARLNSAEYLCSRVDNERDRRIGSGFQFRGVTIQSRPGDLENIASRNQKAILAKMGVYTWEPDFVWIAEDNSFLPLPTPDDMIEMATTAEAHKAKLIFRGAELKARIRAGERFDFTADEEWAA